MNNDNLNNNINNQTGPGNPVEPTNANTIPPTPAVPPQTPQQPNPTPQPKEQVSPQPPQVEVLEEENKPLKEVEINYTPPSKFKVVLLVIFFVFLIGFVIFLPDINSFIEISKENKNANTPKEITTGCLECTMKRTTDNLDINYENIFHFTDSKLNSLVITTTTRGDVDLDEQTLDEEQAKCNLLKQKANQVQGVVISCNYKEGEQEKIENFAFTDINREDLDAAYSEAGGTVVEFENEENIDLIERNMNASGYTCQRKSN